MLPSPALGGVQNFEGEARPPRPAANAGKKLDMRQVRFWHNADHSEAAYGPARLEDHNAFVVRRHCADKAMDTLFRDLPPSEGIVVAQILLGGEWEFL